MHTMNAAGKRLALYFDTRAWVEFEDTYYSLDELLRRLNENDRATEARIQLVAVTASCGARREGRDENITPDWLMDNLTPRQIREVSALAQKAWVEGMHREEVADENQEVDEVAEEIAKKDRADA